MLKRLLDPKAAMLCVAVANMVQVFFQSEDWRFESYMLLSALVLVSTLLLFIKRLWSNFLVAVFTGLLPVVFALEILLIAKNAEVSLFGLAHMKQIIRLVTSAGETTFTLLILSVSVLTCAYCSLGQLIARGKASSEG